MLNVGCTEQSGVWAAAGDKINNNINRLCGAARHHATQSFDIVGMTAHGTTQSFNIVYFSTRALPTPLAACALLCSVHPP
jgi:hypothetical protein